MSMKTYGALSGDLGQFTSENGVLQHNASGDWTSVTNAVVKASGNAKYSTATEIVASGSNFLAMRFHSKSYGSIRISFEAKVSGTGTNYITLCGAATSAGMNNVIRSNPRVTSSFVDIDTIPIGSSVGAWSSGGRYLVVDTGLLGTSYVGYTIEINVLPGVSYYLIQEPNSITQSFRNLVVSYDYLAQETFG